MQIKELSLKELINPTDKQKLWFKAIDQYEFCLFGGSAGGGKSFILRWSLIRLLLKWYVLYKIKGIEVGLFCEDYPSLRDRHVEKIIREFPEWLGTYEKTDSQYRLREEYGGGILKLRNLDNTSKYRSAEFAAIAIDEITMNERKVFDDLYHRRRWAGFPSNFIFPFMAATNPVGIGMGWVKKLWIDRNFNNENFKPESFFFLPSFASDNEHNPKSYLDTLNQLPEKLRKALRDGDWSVFEGQFFPEFGYHLREKPFVIPPTVGIIRGSLDYGESAPTSFNLWYIDNDKRPHLLLTYYKHGMNMYDYAREIKDMVTSFHWTSGRLPDKILADPSIFMKKQKLETDHGTVYIKSPADVFKEYGLNVVPANNDRINGWRTMRYYFEKTNGVPNSYYWSDYNGKYEELMPLAIHDKHRPEDLDTNGEDHCFIGSTKVWTIEGKKEIGSLVGKRISVYTTNGIVNGIGVKTGCSKIIRLSFEDGSHIWCTLEHLFLTSDKRWVRAIDMIDETSYFIVSPYNGGLKCLSKKFQKHVKSSMEKDITFVDTTINQTELDYIEKSINIIWERYQKVIMSITKIMINRLTTLKILNYLKEKNISDYMVYLKLKELVNTCLKQEKQQKYGIKVQKVNAGTQNIMMKTVEKQCQLLLSIFVKHAEENILQNYFLKDTQNIVTPTARPQRCVGVEVLRKPEDVFCLKLDKVHNFAIESGQIVHNCHDSARYFFVDLHSMKGNVEKTESKQRQERELSVIKEKLAEKYKNSDTGF